MKDLTIPEAVERLNALLPEDSYSIDYTLWGHYRDQVEPLGRQLENEYCITTHTPKCKFFKAQTLRSAVETAEQHHGLRVTVDPAVVQEQFAEVQS